jgi:hypothetical protein
MDIAASIVAIVILSLLIFLFRRTRATTNKRPPRPNRLGTAKPDPQFHAVSLEYSSDACEAARSMEGRRFLSSAAPRIPLPECDVPACKCRFIHHKDRREGGDRRKMYRKTGIGDTGAYEKEKRYRGDRRNDDPDEFFS